MANPSTQAIARGLRPGSLAVQIYQHLRRKIMLGTLAPGQKLVELDIAAEMGTSQGPVREALHMLEGDGLVERSARRSTHVTHTSVDEIYAFFTIRSTIEMFAVQQAAAHITDAHINILQSLVNDMHIAAANGDLGLQLEYDMEFHCLICEWSGSQVLVNSWKPLYSQIQRFAMQTHGKYFTSLEEVAATHQPIVDALKHQDAERASVLISDHIMLIWSRMNANDETI